MNQNCDGRKIIKKLKPLSNLILSVDWLKCQSLPSPSASVEGPVSWVIVSPLFNSQSKSSVLSFIHEQKWPANEQLSRKQENEITSENWTKVKTMVKISDLTIAKMESSIRFTCEND